MANLSLVQRRLSKHLSLSNCLQCWFVILLIIITYWVSILSDLNSINTTACFAQERVLKAPRQEKKTVLVVAPPVFNSALQPWIRYRQSQGYEIFLLPLDMKFSNGAEDFSIKVAPFVNPEEIREKILKIANERDIAAIVLVGDGAPTSYAKFGWRDVVPAARIATSIIPVFGGEDTLASDSFYADLDGDGLADVPIGRLPVETPEELEEVVKKIIRYENSSPMGNWVRKINLFAGPNGIDIRAIGSRANEQYDSSSSLGGISGVVDSVINSMARKMFSDFLPQEFSVSLTQCSLTSPFCPYPTEFRNTFLEKLNEGSLFTVYMGHGYVRGLDRLEMQDEEYCIFESDDCKYLNNPNKSPIVLFFACYTGAYDANCPSIAEELALCPNGPVAVYAASRLTAPYGMCVIGSSLLEVAFSSDYSEVEDEPKVLGQMILEAQKLAIASNKEEKRDENDEFAFDITIDEQRHMDVLDELEESVEKDQVEKDSPIVALGTQLEKINNRLEKNLQKSENNKRKKSSFRWNLDRAAAIFDPTASRLEEQIREHILEFNLLGDPLLRVKMPQRIEIEVPPLSYSSRKIDISGTIPNLNDKESVVQVELLLADFRTKVRSHERPRFFEKSPEMYNEYQKTYQAANNFIVDAVRTSTKHGRFATRLVVPSDFSGESIIRVAAFDGTNYYIGSKRILIRPYSGDLIKSSL